VFRASVYTRIDVSVAEHYQFDTLIDFGFAMPLTRAFKSGNSQAVRIPAEIAYDDTDVELSIARYGDVIVITPVRQNLKDMVAALRAMPKPAQIEAYEPTELPDRERD
jgi:antitoxin VapB